MPLISEEPMQPVRHLPTKAGEKLKIYRQLHKIPVEPPCDVCPWRLYPDRVQGCDNVGCGWVAAFLAVRYYQRAKGYWPYAGEEANTVQTLIKDAAKLLGHIRKPEVEDQKDEQV